VYAPSVTHCAPCTARAAVPALPPSTTGWPSYPAIPVTGGSVGTTSPLDCVGRNDGIGQYDRDAFMDRMDETLAAVTATVAKGVAASAQLAAGFGSALNRS
jgi:hypothetical protein